eukprot:c26178_g1_i1.p1 GENE.c26178_g1_i1~~c26178_g1_i1.p1  ORF type:complete len:362 (+),score=70.65 c26178_g1_i1:26-1111(+)
MAALWLGFLALLATLSWGIGEFNLNLLIHLNKRSPDHFPPLTDSEIFFDLGLGTAVSTAIFCVCIKLTSRGTRQIWDKPIMASLSISGALVAVAYVGYQQLSKRVEASSLAPPISLYVCVPIAYGVLAGEPLSLLKVTGIVCAVIALLLFGLGQTPDHTSGLTETIFSNPTNAVLLTTIICVDSISSLASGYSGKYSSSADHLAISLTYGIGMCLVLFAASIGTAQGGPCSFSFSHVLPFLSGACQGVGCYVDNLLVNDSGDISWGTAMISLYTIIPTVLGLLVLGDSITLVKMIGIVFALTAVACLMASKAEPDDSLVVPVDLIRRDSLNRFSSSRDEEEALPNKPEDEQSSLLQVAPQT